MLRVRHPVRAACALAIVFAAVAPAQTPGRHDERPPQVAGLVLSADGTPVAQARVQLTGLGHPELPPTVAWALGDEVRLLIDGVADARGVFKIALPHRGPFTLLATAPDGATTGRRFPVLAGDFVSARLQARSVVAGVVRNADGTPAAGAVLVEAPFSDPGTQRERYGQFVPPATVRADAAGRFRLEIIDADREDIPLSCRSLQAWSSAARSPDRLYRVDGQTLADLDLRLTTPAPRSVPLVAAVTGAPLPQARILDLDASAERVGAGAGEVVSLLTSPYHALAMRAPGHAITRFHQSGLSPGAILRARLLDPEGKAARRRVLLATRDREIPFHIAWQTHTDDEGRLEIDEARIGDPLYGFVEIDGAFVSFFAGVPTAQPRDLGELRVGSGRALTGTVLDGDGLRARGAVVMLQPEFTWENPSAPGGATLPQVLTRLTYTDRAGRFRFDHVPKTPHRCLIAAGVAGLQVFRVDADADVGTVQMDHAVVATATITLPDGSPAAWASVQYFFTPGGEGVRFGGVYLMGRADAQGQLTVRGLPPHGSFTLWGMAAKDGAGFMGSTSGTPAADAALRLVLNAHPGRL